MAARNQEIFIEASQIIRDLYGENASFRPGQYEAIEATMMEKRTLVVQKTGWGKSLVYFSCAKLLKKQNRGLTMVVSPLLVLMENQMEAAQQLKLQCDVLNSTVATRREEIIKSMTENALDLVFVTPETLFKGDLQLALKNIKIGLFVIDEAHCISDWGHDFRQEYGNLHKILGVLPESIPILATTATANNRVISDLKCQMGNNVYVSRGPLTRETLAIQILHLHDKAARYAWILQNIGRLPGSGIIYCLTHRDCDHLADFLSKHNVTARSYYSRENTNEHLNHEAEQLFMQNKIKVLVATIKLGMGYDKGDIGFVIHFQRPGNIVSYYQQVGRAGRNIDRAFAILMTGQEDDEILDYFINTAFPSKEEAEKLISALEENNGLTKSALYSKINKRIRVVDRALSFALNEGFVIKEEKKYYLSAVKFVYNGDHYDEITAVRRKEKEQIKDFTNTKTCLSKYIVNCLDDNTVLDCGICSNCLGKPLFSTEIDKEYQEIAQEYLKGLILPIEPRKKWVTTSMTKTTAIKLINETGICLSKYGDIGYGELVKRDKYNNRQRFCDELVGKSASVLRTLIQEHGIRHLSYVPSLRSNIVEDFAKRLAKSLNIEIVLLLRKNNAQKQKTMQNSSFQCQNALLSFEVLPGVDIPTKLLLIDDIVDSRWTLTVCGYKLRENGCELVIPFALADSSGKEE